MIQMKYLPLLITGPLLIMTTVQADQHKKQRPATDLCKYVAVEDEAKQTLRQCVRGDISTREQAQQTAQICDDFLLYYEGMYAARDKKARRSWKEALFALDVFACPDVKVQLANDYYKTGGYLNTWCSDYEVGAKNLRVLVQYLNDNWHQKFEGRSAHGVFYNSRHHEASIHEFMNDVYQKWQVTHSPQRHDKRAE